MVSSTGLNHLISFYKKVQVHFGQNNRIRDDSENTPDYVFDREQYEMTISKMRTAAKAEFGTGCIFYWKDGDSYCYVPDDDIDILDYWKQQKE